MYGKNDDTKQRDKLVENETQRFTDYFLNSFLISIRRNLYVNTINRKWEKNDRN